MLDTVRPGAEMAANQNNVISIIAASTVYSCASMIARTCVRAAETTILEVGQQGRPCTFPVVRARNVYVLPGVPELLRQKWQVRLCSAEQSERTLA